MGQLPGTLRGQGNAKFVVLDLLGHADDQRPLLEPGGVSAASAYRARLWPDASAATRERPQIRFLSFSARSRLHTVLASWIWPPWTAARASANGMRTTSTPSSPGPPASSARPPKDRLPPPCKPGRGRT